MNRLGEAVSGIRSMEKKWIAWPLVFLILASMLVLVSIFNMPSQNRLVSVLSAFQFGQVLASQKHVFVEAKFEKPGDSNNLTKLAEETSHAPGLPRFAYLIAGSRGDGLKLRRTLAALYHPRNQYVVHLDHDSDPAERSDLQEYIKSDKVYRRVGNVQMIVKANLVTYKGPTMVGNTLHACAILLRSNKQWDWFINLSASDYPLVTQDDLLHVFSTLPRHLNFIEHTTNLGWKEDQRAKPIIIDPGLYRNTKSELFWASEKRELPTAFRLFTGSAWMALSRAFVEFCVWGWDNLPRSLLMYYANFISSPEGYFHTVICNSQEFTNTTVNHDLHYISWDNPPQQHPHNLEMNDYKSMLESNAPFARKFKENHPVLDEIDRQLLGKLNTSFTPGGWCKGAPRNGRKPCLSVGDMNKLKPGAGADRLGKLIEKLLSPELFGPRQCK